jgi:hypothetical protein
MASNEAKDFDWDYSDDAAPVQIPQLFTKSQSELVKSSMRMRMSKSINTRSASDLKVSSADDNGANLESYRESLNDLSRNMYVALSHIFILTYLINLFY